MDFVIGGVAGAGATFFTNPMDVVKTRLQLQGELVARADQAKRYRGVFHALYIIGKMDGAFALQKGLAPAMLLGFCMNSVRLGIYRVSEVHGWIKTDKGQISIPHAMFWAAVSGATGGLAANPASVVKTRIQAAAHPSIAVGRQHRYKGTYDAFSSIYRTEGLRGFFAGLSATCWKVAVGSMAQLTTFSVSKEALLSHGIIDEHSPFLLAFAATSLSGMLVALGICPFDVVTCRLYNQGNEYFSLKESLRERGICANSPAALAFIASLLSGVIVVVVETPLDVVNTRMFNQGSAQMEGGLLYNGVVDCLRKIYRTEGLHGLYKGVGPLYLRIAPQTTISLVIWDMLSNILKGRAKHQEKIASTAY